LYSCRISSAIQTKKLALVTVSYKSKKTKRLTEEEKQNWQHKDLIEDTIAGISLDKAYQELKLNDRKNETVIIAVLDMRIHKDHEDVKDFIWTNPNEIPNNNIDDDNNGYVDDIHGWNFLGNTDGTQAHRANFEYVRIIRKFDEKFKNKKRTEIDSTLVKDYNLYLKAKEAYNDELQYVRQKLSSLQYKKVKKDFLEKELTKIFPDIKLSITNLQTLQSSDSKVSNFITDLISLKKDSVKNASNYKSEKRFIDIYLNTEYPERAIIGDDEHNLNDTVYGNNIVASDTTEDSHTHAIKVAGVIVGNRQNNKGIKGVTNNAQIMPIAISPYGDEQDKDIALGIRYAVDNGAKIINISSSKYFSLYPDWVMQALKYADDNDVLVVTSAGNLAYDLDKQQSYPTDVNLDHVEIVKNVITVGASTHFLDENIVHYTSNFGKENVDIFAPGRKVYTTSPNNTYTYSSGTSYSAPIVSGVATLIRSYYPNLSAREIKDIILNSGVSINLEVNVPGTSNPVKKVPFNSLSKSGKIVNAYNALLMAEEVSKSKKR
jgi:subtilisin family serine protease